MHETDWRDLPLVDILSEGANALGLTLNEAQKASCLLYLDLMLERNRQFNLTAIRDPHDALVKHFLDSLTALPLLPLAEKLRIVDVGTGAGFPGVVWKIMRPDLRMTLLDSSRKRLLFLEEIIERLTLKEIGTVHLRAEDAGHARGHRERYDVVTARAVAELRVLAEYCLPLARVGGLFLAMKGPRGSEELHDALPVLRELGGEEYEPETINLPYLNESRLLIPVQKIKPTPSYYPRTPAEIQKRPL